MANIYEVAELAGVSLATVSRVINPGAKVSDKTRQKVLAAMQQLGYQPNSIAQSLATRSSNAVGVLVSELHGPFFGAMLSAIEQTLKAAGKFVLVAAGHSKEEQEREAIRFLVSRNCDALIVHVERLSDKFLVDHDHNTTPLVVMNRKVRGLADHCFSLNNELGGYLATQSLLKHKHKRIAYISGPLDWVDAKQRFAGHKRALDRGGRQVRRTAAARGRLSRDRRPGRVECAVRQRTFRSPRWCAPTTRWPRAPWRPRTSAASSCRAICPSSASTTRPFRATCIRS